MTRVRWADLNPKTLDRLRLAGFVNGCGPKFRVLNYLVPDVIFGLNVEEDCDRHDLNYLIGHTEADRIKADWQFYEEIRNRALAKTRHWWRRWLRPIYLMVAWSYYRGVRAWGSNFFYYSDEERSYEELVALLGQEEE